MRGYLKSCTWPAFLLGASLLWNPAGNPCQSPVGHVCVVDPQDFLT